MKRRALSAGGMRALGANLKAARDKRGWSQGDAAERIGVQQSALSMWESGTRLLDIDNLIRIAAAYQCPLDDLMGGVDERYDAIIERRIPLDVRRHYEARIDAYVQANTAAWRTALSGPALAPSSRANDDARATARGKAAATRVRRRKRPKQT